MRLLVISSKDSYAAKRLTEEAKKTNQVLEICAADKIALIKAPDFDVLYVRNPFVGGGAEFLPQVIDLAKKFNTAGKMVVDAAIAEGDLAMGKWKDYERLIESGLPTPHTVIARSEATKQSHYPTILKWTYGFKGRHVFLVNSDEKYNQIIKKYPQGELLEQEYIEAQFEYKVICVGYKALPVILRFAINAKTHRPDFRKFTVITIPAQAVIQNSDMTTLLSIAEKSSQILGRELSKVDILESNGKFYILEVNRFPGLQSFEKLTKYNVVKEFLEYLRT